MVRIRMKRMGRTHRPFYRINAVEKREKRDGKVLENLGWYDPVAQDADKQVHLKEDRIKHWLGQGAQPSDTVMDLLAKNGLVSADEVQSDRERRLAKKRAGIVETKQAAAAAEKKAAEEKAAAEAKAKKEAEEKARAEAAAAAEAPAES